MGYKKNKFIHKYFDQDDNLVMNLDDKDANYITDLLESLADLAVCPHLDRIHRAKFMCHSCYHGRGNLLKAWKCEHKDKPNHSNGMCKKCYHK